MEMSASDPGAQGQQRQTSAPRISASRRDELHFQRPPVALVMAVVMTAVLEVLDTTIVNVAVPRMLGAFAARPDQIAWVLTSYIVASAVVMPLTGYLSRWLSRRRLLFVAISGFVFFSALSGMAWSLQSMVLFRIAQGVFGASLVPLSQGILLDTFPRERHGQALAVFGLGIMVAPLVGPALGGYLTDTFSWRAVFYINIPIGILALVLSYGFLPKRPIAELRTDWVGMGLLVLAVGALQYVLDQGQIRGWLSSRVIVIGIIVAVFTSMAFVVRGWNKKDNIVDLTLLRDRNFLVGTLAISAYSLSLYGWMAIMPLFTQRLLGNPADIAGLLFIPRGLISAVTLALAGGILVRVFDARFLVIGGLVMVALGTLPMAFFSLNVDHWDIIKPSLVAGFGAGLFFVPLTVMAFANIRDEQYDEAAGIYALMRGIGGSAGIAVVTWLFERQTQVHLGELAAQITPYNPDIASYLGRHGLSPGSLGAQPLIAHKIINQAQLLAFSDVFWFIALLTLSVIPLILFMHRQKRSPLVPAV